MLNQMDWAMIAISVLAGLLSTMNIWVANVKDIRFHLNDIYMVMLMTSWMFLFGALYHGISLDKIVIGGIAVIITLWLIRKQIFINDREFLKGMIPHHSMAILMSEKIREKTSDPRIVNLANNIIKAQTEEIEYMNYLLKNKN